MEVSPLLHALYEGRRADAEALAGAVPELSVFEAAALGRIECVHELLHRDPSLARACSPDGFTALHLAAFLGTRDVMAALLDAGADIDAVARNGMRVRPLHSAAASHDTEKLRLLVERGATLDGQQQGGYTALHEAALHGSIDRTSLLLEAGADPTITADDGRSAADMAREAGYDEIVSLLVRSVP